MRISHGRQDWAHRRHNTCVESVVVQPTNTFRMIPEKPPEKEGRDSQWEVATEQVRDLHGVPRRGVYLQNRKSQSQVYKKKKKATR